MPSPKDTPRRFHAYCVGAPKSGTHSIAAVFHRTRAAHEPKPLELIQWILLKNRGLKTPQECRDFIVDRDRRLNLEMESNNNLVYFLEELVSLFPEARFVMTIRDCYSSVDSRINHDLARRAAWYRPILPNWRKLWDVKFEKERLTYEPEEELMKQFGLYTLRGYFAAWAAHTQKVLDTVPEEQLLIVKTKEIGASLSKIAHFVGVDPALLDPQASHAFKVKKKYQFLSRLDPVFLKRTVHEQCRSLMDRFYPEIHCLEDALGKRQ